MRIWLYAGYRRYQAVEIAIQRRIKKVKAMAVPNIAAFLDMLVFSEGTATHNNGYDAIVTGIDDRPEIFTDYRDHPFLYDEEWG